MPKSTPPEIDINVYSETSEDYLAWRGSEDTQADPMHTPLAPEGAAHA